MPELRCPIGDYTAKGSTLAAAAQALSQHLLSQHCDTAPDDARAQSSDLSSGVSGDVSLEGLDPGDISVRGEVEIDPSIQPGRQR